MKPTVMLCMCTALEIDTLSVDIKGQDEKNSEP